MSDTSDKQPDSDSRHDTSDLEFDSLTHEGVQSMADDNVFEPGPSFVENDRPTDRLTEMPAWLQTFAATAIEKGEMPADDETTVEPTQSHTASQERVAADPDPTLPDWLRDDSRQLQSQPSTPVGTLETFEDFEIPHASGAASFISEDDLPDWLRAFSEETSQATPLKASAPRGPNVPGSTAASAAIVRVPPVENIWLSTFQRQALGPGPTLFALLASNGNGEIAHEPAQSQDDEMAESSSSARSDASSDLNSTAGPNLLNPETKSEAGEQRNSTRLLLITLCIVLVLVVLSALFLS